MYAKRQSLEEFRAEEALKKEVDSLKLQVSVLQQKNQGLKNELNKALESEMLVVSALQKKNDKINSLSEIIEAEKKKVQKALDAEREVRAAVQEKSIRVNTLSEAIEDERSKVKRVLDSEHETRIALQEKTAQINRLTEQINAVTGHLTTVQSRTDTLREEKEEAQKQLRIAQEQIQAQLTLLRIASNNNQRSGEAQSFRHVPYVFEVTPDTKASIVKDEKYFYYIEDDDSRGLKTQGRAGYIKNDGPGDITYRLYDKIQDTWSYPAVIKAGESDKFDYTDNIRVSTIEIIPDSNGTMFRLRFTAGIEPFYENATGIGIGVEAKK